VVVAVQIDQTAVMPLASSAQGVSWGDVPTWAGVGVSFLALIAAVFAGIAGVRLLAVELRRDDEQQRSKEATQAERVAAWPAIVLSDFDQPDSALTWGALVLNGSDLPIYGVELEYQPLARGEGQRDAVKVEAEFISPGRWLVNHQEMYERPEEWRPGTSAERLELPDRNFVVAISFWDAANRRWSRDRYGVLRREEIPLGLRYVGGVPVSGHRVIGPRRIVRPYARG
jgi:hypothetical protein